jgi:hypothetical protein
MEGAEHHHPVAGARQRCRRRTAMADVGCEGDAATSRRQTPAQRFGIDPALTSDPAQDQSVLAG